jgi:hypothetical protein
MVCYWQAVESLEDQKSKGEITDEEFTAKKKDIVSRFWKSLIEGSGAQRTIQPRDILVQVERNETSEKFNLDAYAQSIF